MTSFVAGMVIDQIPVKTHVLGVSMFFGVLANLSLVRMASMADGIIFGLMYGLFVGLLNACYMVCFADLFGRAHLGSINGVTTMIFQTTGGKTTRGRRMIMREKRKTSRTKQRK